MKLAVSNIAWKAEDDATAYAMLRELGVQRLEIAPTRFWPNLLDVTESMAREQAERLANEGLPVCAFQALLFGKPELQLFGNRDLIDYTKRVCQIASWMGAKALVFGSPKNRLRGELAADVAFAKAREAFREIGDFAAERNVMLCLEANPPGYGGDFMTTAPEAAALVRAIDSPGIALNFDMGEVIMNGEDASALIRECLPIIAHFHISEPLLEPFQPTRREQLDAAQTLREVGYDGVVSVEMKTPATGGLAVVREAVEAIKRVHGL